MMKKKMIKARALGYRMPAEWEPHAATWLSWPHKLDSWPGKFDPVPGVFGEIIKHLFEHEVVHINISDDEMKREVEGFLPVGSLERGQVRLHYVSTNDAWARDHGPTFVSRLRENRRELAIIDWEFNAWGGKYPPYDLDNEVPARVAEILDLPHFKAGIVMEGGSIDVNGLGSLLTTESCLLNPNRNRHLTKQEIEQYLIDYLGVTNILWLGDGIVGDDTDGHIDDLARFVDPTTVVTVVEDDTADENYALLRDNYERLVAMKDQAGAPLRIVTLPMPGRIEFDGQRLPASYANFYIANNVVLVPTFNQPNDEAALQTLQTLFPNRRVIGIYCTDLVWGLGAVHCVTQQQPISD
ncbi:MAG: agmatine deiminase family protein [Pyrinomonadaceae bacterium]